MKTGDIFLIKGEKLKIVIDNIEGNRIFYHYIGEVVTPPNSNIMFKEKFEEMLKIELLTFQIG